MTLSTYLDIFEARRKHEKLGILREYADELAKEDAAQPEYFKFESVNNEIGPMPDPQFAPQYNKSADMSDDMKTRALVLHLEKGYLRANDALQKEKKLLAEAKEKYKNLSASDTSRSSDGNGSILALSRTRDELVDWMEEQLARVNEIEDASETTAPTNPSTENVPIEEWMATIRRLYNHYLSVRRSLVAFSLKPRNAPNLEELKIAKQEEIQTPGTSRSPKATTIFETSLVIPYLTEHLIPTADVQQTSLQEKSHITNTLYEQNRATERILTRLADESHLLANYPMPATQPGFQDAVVPLNGLKLQPPPFKNESDVHGEASIIKHGQAWAFAAEAAKKAQDETLAQKLQQGEEHAMTAKATLLELQNLLHGGGEVKKAGEEDIWVERSQPKASQYRGVWAGLDGKIRGPIDRGYRMR